MTYKEVNTMIASIGIDYTYDHFTDTGHNQGLYFAERTAETTHAQGRLAFLAGTCPVFEI